jgi:predicted nuclease of predicted toxin-antitoxin system
MSTNESNTPKLLLDEHIWVYLATLLREQGFDVIHVSEDELEGKPDDEILRVATENHRAVVTFNIKDFIPLAIQYFDDGKEHYGVVVSDQISQGELQRRVTNLLKKLTVDELKNTIRFLQDYK